MKYQKYTITYVIEKTLLRTYAKSLAKALIAAKNLERMYKTTTTIVKNF